MIELAHAVALVLVVLIVVVGQVIVPFEEVVDLAYSYEKLFSQLYENSFFFYLHDVDSIYDHDNLPLQAFLIKSIKCISIVHHKQHN